MNNENWEKEFVEKGAELEHIRWAKWQNYLHTFLTWNDEVKGWVLSHKMKEWWDSEIRTPYSMLSEEQKESDRKETREYLRIVRSLLASYSAELCEMLDKEMVNIGNRSFIEGVYTALQNYEHGIEQGKHEALSRAKDIIKDNQK